MKYGNRDKNHKLLRDYARACGAWWEDTADVGRGFPDAVIGFCGLVYLVEIKSDKDKLNEKELELHKRALLIGKYEIPIIRCTGDIDRLLGIKK
jgi:hypothetical protein